MKPKILIVDDSKTARLVVAGAFKGFECEVLEAADGAEGLALVNREKPDLVLLDATMPGMDGVEMLRGLRAEANWRQLPVIMLTSQTNREAVVRIARLGVRDYLVKPFAEETLVERVGRILELQPKGAAAPRAKRFDEPLTILLLEDKPAIQERVKQGLADTPWKVEARATLAEAVDFCRQNPPDVVLASLSVAEDAAWALAQSLRAGARTRKVPVLGLSVKTAVEEQQRARESGFWGVIAKPLQMENVKVEICRALNLDTSGKYFEQRDRALILRVPPQVSGEIVGEILGHLPGQLATAVAGGCDKMVLDLSPLQRPGPGLVALAANIVRRYEELTLDYRIVAADEVSAECRKHEEASQWTFAASLDEALAMMSAPEPVAA